MKLREPKDIKKSTFFRLFLPTFIAITLILSVFGIVISRSPENESFKYKEHLFIKENNGFSTRINNQKYSFLYDPRTLENLTIAPLTLTQLTYGTKFYISANPKEDIGLGLSEFYRLIKPLINKKFVQACTEDVEGCGNLLIKTCNDATPEEKVVVFKESNSTFLNYNINCLTIQGSGEDMGRLIDKLALNFIL